MHQKISSFRVFLEELFNVNRMIGIDIGRVIISGDTDIPDQFFGDDYLNVRQIAGAFDAIQQIVAAYKPENVHLVSKCGEATQARSRHWLQHHGFFETTNFAYSNLWFCQERHQKQAITAQHGIRTFIDDRFSVLKHLLDLDKLYLFCPSVQELADCQGSAHTNKITVVNGWADVLKTILP